LKISGKIMCVPFSFEFDLRQSRSVDMPLARTAHILP
jgi:hypothetical protein